MPVYVYQCESCGVRFDRYQQFTELSLTWCPECGKKSLRKVYSPVGIVFKGSGFYATDNRSPSGISYAKDKNADKAEEPVKPAVENKPTEADKPASDTKTEKTEKTEKPTKPATSEPKE